MSVSVSVSVPWNSSYTPLITLPTYGVFTHTLRLDGMGCAGNWMHFNEGVHTLLPEEMVTHFFTNRLTFGTHFLIVLFYPLLLHVLNVNSVIFTLISSDWFYICFHGVVLGHLLVQLSAAFMSCWHIVFHFHHSLLFFVSCVSNK